MSVIEAIKKRNSSAFMAEDDVDNDLIRQILDAAVCTPVHYKTNPWRFLVIRGEGRHKLGNFMADRLAKEMDDPSSDKNIRFLDKIRKKALRAPIIIVAAAAKSDCKDAMMVEDIASVSAACQNILLSADELGLSAIWRTGSLAYDPRTVSFLGFDRGTEIVGFIYLGHPLKEIGSKPRETSGKYTRFLE
ncbi:MAG: nitroreductase [Emcibacter sp.]|nr:nitroreductase [Emcibacter sp.]